MNIEAIRFRLFWMKYGVFFMRGSSLMIRRLKIGGSSVNLSVPEGEADVMLHEVKTIFYDDCYGLGWHQLNREVCNIVDIGGNIGLFSMAARDAFPDAVIHAYEPNPIAFAHCERNTDKLRVQLWSEAVGGNEGFVKVENRSGSLFSTTTESDDGSISMIPARQVLDRIGSEIDLLKMDCEGAEWEIFNDKDFWESVNNVVMEYHLWADRSKSIGDLISILIKLGFRITYLRESEKRQWGIIWGAK